MTKWFTRFHYFGLESDGFPANDYTKQRLQEMGSVPVIPTLTPVVSRACKKLFYRWYSHKMFSVYRYFLFRLTKDGPAVHSQQRWCIPADGQSKSCFARHSWRHMHKRNKLIYNILPRGYSRNKQLRKRGTGVFSQQISSIQFEPWPWFICINQPS